MDGIPTSIHFYTFVCARHYASVSAFLHANYCALRIPVFRGDYLKFARAPNFRREPIISIARLSLSEKRGRCTFSPKSRPLSGWLFARPFLSGNKFWKEFTSVLEGRQKQFPLCNFTFVMIGSNKWHPHRDKEKKSRLHCPKVCSICINTWFLGPELQWMWHNVI